MTVPDVRLHPTDAAESPDTPPPRPVDGPTAGRAPWVARPARSAVGAWSRSSHRPPGSGRSWLARAA